MAFPGFSPTHATTMAARGSQLPLSRQLRSLVRRGTTLVPASLLALLLTAAVPASAPASVDLAVRPWSPSDPRVSPHWRAAGREILARRAAAARGAPHLISQPGVNWSPEADRRRGWRPSLAAQRDIRDTLNGGRGRPILPQPDTVNVAFIRIDFASDRGGSASTGNGRFDLDPGDTLENPVDRPPHNRKFFEDHHEALARYYDAMSYGREVITGRVWPSDPNGAYTCSDMADLGPWKFSQDIESAAVHMFRSFMFAADTQSIALGDSIPWGSIDRIVFIHAGGDLQSDVRQDSKEDIPSFTIGVSDSNAVVFKNADGTPRTRPISRATFVPETANQDGYFGTLNGVIAHECGHLIFGFIDLYNVETGFPVVGFWSLMDSGNLVGAVVKTSNGDSIFATGLLPPSVDPFHRFFATDVLDLPEANYGRLDSLQNSERHPDMRRVTLSSDEFLVLENRHLSAAPYDSVRLDQDETSRVILGPKAPDRYEYDSLTPGGGILVWHIDESVIPFENSLRPNPDYAVNTNHNRLGVKVVEADGLDDLGDLGSPFLLGSYRDPWYVGNNTVLTDDTTPNLRSNSGTRPHVRIEVLDTLLSTIRVRIDRAWQAPGWPVNATQQFPPGGPQLLAVDADGDGKLEVCWAGGDSTSADSTGLFAIRSNGSGLGSSDVITALDRRPRPVMAALPTGGPRPEQGPALFAVTTYASPPGAPSAGGQLWLVDHNGFTYGSAWPVAPGGTRLSTPPVFAGEFPNARIVVGAEDGYVYAFTLDGTLAAQSSVALAGGVRGRLAVAPVGDLGGSWMVAAGGDQGDVGIFLLKKIGSVSEDPVLNAAAPMFVFSGWPQRLVTHSGFIPDFLWMNFDGEGGAAGDPSGCGSTALELVVHDADRLWAFCTGGRLLPGWGRSLGDTLAPGLGAGDPDGDGFPEVLVQTQNSKVGFINLTGGPSPGWPKPGSGEGVLHDDTLLTAGYQIHRFPTLSPPLALDVDGSRRPAVVALNTSGIIAALRLDGHQPQGWPLATGAGTSGAPLAADLDRDGLIELVAPDRFGTLYGYSLPVDTSLARASSWTMLGGDPERTCWLPASRTSIAPAARSGPIVAGSLKAYPNPARRRPVTLAYTLTEPASVEVRVLDTSGHEVASFHRDGRIAENLEVWDPGSVPAGLYLLHVNIKGRDSETAQIVPVGVLK